MTLWPAPLDPPAARGHTQGVTTALILAVLSAAPAAAQSPASCIHVSSGAAPTTLDELRSCQDRSRAAAVAAARNGGSPLTGEQLDRLDEAQRAEAREFLAAPGRVVSGGPTPAAAAPARTAGEGEPAPTANAETATAPAAGSSDAATLADLKARLGADAGDGGAGITPAMAEDARKTLESVQGDLSPDMKKLLDAVSRDGARLTPDTMTLLQGAGRAAKGQGQDLGLDPAVEKALLESDFNADKPAFEAAKPPSF